MKISSHPASVLRRSAVAALVKARRASWAVRLGRRSLDELALWYGADKSTAGHGFAPIYEGYLDAWRDRPMTVIEIGVYRGASLRMWRDYFERGRIFGLDVSNESAKQSGERIDVTVGDQADPQALADLLAASGPPDLVIDDGGHRIELQGPTLQFLWPHLKPGGLYIIEDTHTSYLSNYGMGWRREPSTIETLKGFVDDLHHDWHESPTVFDDLEYVHFYKGTCILKKRVPKGTRLLARLDAAAARASGAWTG